MRKLDKDKKIFLGVGLPIFIFLILFYATHYFQITVFFIAILIFAAVGLTRKDRIWLRITKIGLFTFIFYIIMFNNLVHLPSQFVRRFPGGRNALIEPNNPNIEKTKQEFYIWDNDTYVVNFTSLDDNNRTELEWKMARVDRFVYHEKMEYTFDTNKPYYYYDFLPTIDEIFMSDTDNNGRLEDDCDGITLVTASLLLNMGYNAWIEEVEFHYHTRMFPAGADPKTSDGYALGIDLYNSWGRPPYIMFNQTETIIPPNRPIYLSIFDVLTGTSLYENYLVDFLDGSYFGLSPYIMIFIAYAALLIISIGLTIFVKVGNSLESLEKKVRRKKLLKISFVNSFISSGGMFALYMFSVNGMGFLGTLILGLIFISVFRFTDYALKRISR